MTILLQELIKDRWDAIESRSNYVVNSLFMKENRNDRGVILEWLERNTGGTASVRQRFIELDVTDINTKIVLDRPAYKEIDIKTSTNAKFVYTIINTKDKVKANVEKELNAFASNNQRVVWMTELSKQFSVLFERMVDDE